MQLQRHLPEFEAAGIAVFAISYDSTEVLSAFATEFGITYPLLSDAGSEVIRRYGILNTLVGPDESVFGIPYPGSYLTDEAGVVAEKLFYRQYRLRPSTTSVLKDGFGVSLAPENPRAESSAPGVRVSVTLGEDALVFQQRVPLYVTFDLDPGLHIYAPDSGGGMVGTSVTVTAPEDVSVGPAIVPDGHPLRLEGAEEALLVLDGAVEFAVPLVSTHTEGASVTLDIRVAYQACDDRQCFLPQEQTIRLEVPLQGLNRARPRS